VDDDELADYEGPWQVAAGTPGNLRFGALLKSMRERSGLSPQQLAEQADVHVSFVRGIERGAQAPSVATAHPLLACMKEQHRIQWMDSGPYDLLIRDPGTGRDVAFEFKAKVKGQNRRTDVDPAVTAGALLKLVEAMPRIDPAVTAGALLKLAEAMPRIVPQVAETGEPRADVVRHGGDGQLRWSAPADDARFGRVVRLLGAADEELLGRVESLLRDELGPGQSSS
jgi:DNA-binding XRE family transcriptional regulator